ncbi:MAG TPA: pyridoxamine 5'-phosphate oxidase family protein [Propionibacteriaceae bacterium]|nr:pyridoxamine 5'-phosphate oxidase family protein [Propionibacteriaceae bacterium]
MVELEPVTDLGAFSSDGAVATEWAKALADLQGAEVYWLSTVRPDGRPHVTPLLGIWLDGALYFCTGPSERKAELRSVADTFESKYGRRFTAPDGTWFGLGDAIRGGDARVYRVAPSTAFGFGKGRQFSQTRWRFS